MMQNKKHKQTLESVQYGLEISFKLWFGKQNNFSIPPKLAKNAIAIFQGLELVMS